MASTRHLQRPLIASSRLRLAADAPRFSRSLSTSRPSPRARGNVRPNWSIALTLLALTAYAYTRPRIHLDATHAQNAPASLLPPNQSSEQAFDIEPASSQKVPRIIPPPVSLAASDTRAPEELVLFASGVRTVSFLRVQVYVAALYVTPSALEGFLRDHTDGPGTQSASLEQTMKQALQAGVPMVLKIIPVKNTDFAHLRDGFTRAVQSRQRLLRKVSPPPTEQQEEALSLSLQRLKECFPKASLKKGEHLDLVFQPTRVTAPSATSTSNGRGVDLAFEHDRVVLGSVQYDEGGGEVDVARLLFEAYVADKDPVSEPFKKAIESSFQRQFRPA